MGEKLQKLIPCVISVAVFCVAAVVALWPADNVFYKTTGGNNTPFPRLYSESRLEQDLVMSKSRTISRIDICFATYARENQGETTVSFAVNGNIVDEVAFPTNELKDNAFHEIDGLEIPVQEGDTLTISVVNDADEDNAITIWISSQLSGGELRRVVGDTASAVSGEAKVRLYYRISLGDYISSWYLRQDGTVANILILGVCALISLLAFELLQKNEREFAEVEEK